MPAEMERLLKQLSKEEIEVLFTAMAEFLQVICTNGDINPEIKKFVENVSYNTSTSYSIMQIFNNML